MPITGKIRRRSTDRRDGSGEGDQALDNRTRKTFDCLENVIHCSDIVAFGRIFWRKRRIRSSADAEPRA